MEYGLTISALCDLPRDPREFCSVGWRNDLPPGPLRALYFGTEFCQDLLPAVTEAAHVCRRAEEAGLEAVLLTPPVTDRGLTRVARLYRGLIAQGCRPSVLFNDWGVFNWLQQSHPAARLRAGRLINRALRDPRLIGQVKAPAMESALRGDRIRKLLKRRGVVAVETDPDLEGGFLGNFDGRLQRVVHLPYTFVASGRNCLVKADKNDGDGSFNKGLGKPCRRPCQGQFHRVEREDVAVALWRAGNTTFFEVPRFLAEAYIERADRIVLHDRPRP